jgi:replication-associated recombination protein RarA
MLGVANIECFVGCGEELDTIHSQLQHDGSRKTVVLHGLSGMGKTQLALVYAQRYKDEYSAVSWVYNKDVDTLRQGYAVTTRCIYRDHPSL